jgi:hypothetical protein
VRPLELCREVAALAHLDPFEAEPARHRRELGSQLGRDLG